MISAATRTSLCGLVLVWMAMAWCAVTADSLIFHHLWNAERQGFVHQPVVDGRLETPQTAGQWSEPEAYLLAECESCPAHVFSRSLSKQAEVFGWVVGLQARLSAFVKQDGLTGCEPLLARAPKLSPPRSPFSAC